MMHAEQPVSVFWFRRDLRLHDNHGLYMALKSQNAVLPIFIFDKTILNDLKNKQDKRVCFIYEMLLNLNAELKKFGSSIYIVFDTPLNAFENICSRFNVKEVFTNHDYEPYAIERDNEVSKLLQKRNIAFHTFKDQVIFEKSEILKADHTPYTVFTPYANAWKKKYISSRKSGVAYESENLLSKLYNNIFPFPSLNDIGFEKTIVKVSPPLVEKATILAYERSRDFLAEDGTTKLSIHLRFGTVSIRQLCKLAHELSDTWLNELIWREFFMMILFHFPYVVTKSFKAKYDHIRWRNNEREFEAWCKGETGYPIVDAGMRELNQTGFMHNRARMIVASFLTKHLLIDWRWGEAYFAEKLLDFELSSNNGNWQWAAGCGCDAAPYFRIFNPMAQTKRFDPKMIYIEKWLGDLNNYKILPIVEHEYARKLALETYKKYLNDPT